MATLTSDEAPMPGFQFDNVKRFVINRNFKIISIKTSSPVSKILKLQTFRRGFLTECFYKFLKK
jgi:hypothetical protein